MRALLGKLHRSENCPERKVEVFIGLWVTVSLLISFRSQKPGFLAPITDRLEAGGARGQGELFTGSTISEGQLCPPSAPVWHPLQPHVTAHLQDEIAAHVSSQFFFSHSAVIDEVADAAEGMTLIDKAFGLCGVVFCHGNTPLEKL